MYAVCALTARSVDADAPRIRVTAGTRVELYPELGTESLRVRGVLLDDLDAPIAHKEIQLRVEATDGTSRSRRRVRTGADGTFSATLPRSADQYVVEATFDGDAEHGTSAVERPVERSRVPVRLRFLKPTRGEIELAREHTSLLLRASSSEDTEGLRVSVKDELGRAVATGVTDAHGIFEATLRSTELGRPGTGRWIVHSDADTRRAAAHGELSVVRMASSQVTLEHATRTRDGALQVRGQLTALGEPLADKTIGVFVDDRHLGSVQTDATGRFQFEGALPAGNVTARVHARFDSDAPWLRSSRSGVRELAEPSHGARRAWLLLPLLASLLVLAWMARRDRRASAPQAPRIGLAPAPGVRPGARSRALATVRHVGGSVHSADTGRPLAQARVELSQSDAEPLVLPVAADGTFRSPTLVAGPVRLRISSPAFEDRLVELTVPHRGEWSALVAHLDSLRTAALRVFDRAASRATGQPADLHHVTPREALAAGRARGNVAELLSSLGKDVERAAYAKSPPAADDLARITTLAEQLDRVPGPPGPPRRPPHS